VISNSSITCLVFTVMDFNKNASKRLKPRPL
jgi:hypothetical protein